MKSKFTLLMLLLSLICAALHGQDEEQKQEDSTESDYSEYREYREYKPERRRRQHDYEISTIFRNRSPHASGGYIAFSNKFTTINGDYANMVEVYGGWYLNHQLLIGVGVAATTNHLPVPSDRSTAPWLKMSYEYGQAGLMTEYVIANNRAVHLSFQMFGGAGFTLQYPRYSPYNDYWDTVDDVDHDEDFFFVMEPGMQLEVNVFRWMRICPGVSYRKAFNKGSNGLSNKDIDGSSVSMTLKLGKF